MKHVLLMGLLLGMVACGSSDDSDNGGSGGTSGSDDVAARICAHKVEGGCTEDSFCENRLRGDQAVAKSFGCGAEFDAYAECLTQNAWKCEANPGGGQVVFEPTECASLKQAYSACEPSCGHSIINDVCQMSCDIGGQQVGVDCPNGPSSCTCSQGPKAGTALTLAECDRGLLAEAIVANCQ